MIYLDNAATSYPKPRSVYNAVAKCMRRAGGNPGRGSHALADAAAEAVYRCREAAGEMFGCEPENVVLTFNATHALNLAIKGFAGRGGHILISDIEHNSVYRPVRALCETHGYRFDIYSSCGGREDEVIEDIKSKLTPDTDMIIANHASNICSLTLPIERIGNLCRERGITFIVDASQSAGHMKLDMRDISADAVCMPGHKGLYGPQGSGLLLLRGDRLPNTLIEGGSGINSLDAFMPDILPERLEAGTLSAPCAAGLEAGIRWVNSVGVEALHAHECELASILSDELMNMESISVYAPHLSGSSGVVLFGSDNMLPSALGEVLDGRGICVRCGLHCSPLAHSAVRSGENGAVRVSFGYFNTMTDVRLLTDVLYKASRGRI